MQRSGIAIGLLLAVAGGLGLSSVTAHGQDSADAETKRVQREVIIRRELDAGDDAQAPQSPEMEERLRAAEARLEEAAQEIAEITSRMVPGAVDYARQVLAAKRRPVLGVSIGGRAEDDGGPVDGVQVLGVSPGSPAEDAGIRAGDVLTRIDGQSLAAGDAGEANRRLLDALREREPGDSIALEVLRGGKRTDMTVQTRDADSHAYALFGDGDFEFEFQGSPPMVWFGHSRPWGDMELVELTPSLGRYFGTDKGLLVVRAPSDPSLKLEDGDVIRSIGGREPKSVSHAMRILRSYDEGETFELEIMRDNGRRKLDVQIPASQGRWVPDPPAAPPAPAAMRSEAAMAPRAPAAVPAVAAHSGLPEV